MRLLCGRVHLTCADDLAIAEISPTLVWWAIAIHKSVVSVLFIGTPPEVSYWAYINYLKSFSHVENPGFSGCIGLCLKRNSYRDKRNETTRTTMTYGRELDL